MKSAVLIEFIRFSRDEIPYRKVESLFPIKTWSYPQDGLIFVVFPTRKSSMMLSAELLEEKTDTDTRFHEIVCASGMSDIDQDRLLCFDSSGSCLASGVSCIDVTDVIDSVTHSGLFQTLELGCCRVISHHKYKTKCLVCTLAIRGSESYIADVLKRIEVALNRQPIL
jgi:hypothetical protein